MVWNRVAMPANSIDIWIRYRSSGKSGLLEPKPNPAAPATMMAGVTLETNIASTCWMPKGHGLVQGRRVIGIAQLFRSVPMEVEAMSFSPSVLLCYCSGGAAPV